MFRLALGFSMLMASSLVPLQVSAQWAAPAASAIPEARGYVAVPAVAFAPDKNKTYRAIYEATRAAAEPTQLLPALNMAGLALNAFAASGVPMSNAKFVVVVRGPAMAGILNDASYRTKFGATNPNLKVISGLKKAGVEIFVCAQSMVAENIDPKALSSEVRLASAAQIVLMVYQNDGYAVLTY